MSDHLVVQWLGGPQDGEFLALPPGTSELSIAQAPPLEFFYSNSANFKTLPVQVYSVPIKDNKLMWYEKILVRME